MSLIGHTTELFGFAHRREYRKRINRQAAQHDDKEKAILLEKNEECTGIVIEQGPPLPLYTQPLSPPKHSYSGQRSVSPLPSFTNYNEKTHLPSQDFSHRVSFQDQKPFHSDKVDTKSGKDGDQGDFFEKHSHDECVTTKQNKESNYYENIEKGKSPAKPIVSSENDDSDCFLRQEYKRCQEEKGVTSGDDSDCFCYNEMKRCREKKRGRSRVSFSSQPGESDYANSDSTFCKRRRRRWSHSDDSKPEAFRRKEKRLRDRRRRDYFSYDDKSECSCKEKRHRKWSSGDSSSECSSSSEESSYDRSKSRGRDHSKKSSYLSFNDDSTDSYYCRVKPRGRSRNKHRRYEERFADSFETSSDESVSKIRIHESNHSSKRQKRTAKNDSISSSSVESSYRKNKRRGRSKRRRDRKGKHVTISIERSGSSRSASQHASKREDSSYATAAGTLEVCDCFNENVDCFNKLPGE